MERALIIADGANTRQCSAHNRQGERCKNTCAPGQFVCHMHGAKSPQAQRNGRERLHQLIDPAMEVIYRATRHAPPCDKCGRSDSDRDPVALKAAQLVLDRTGFHPTLAIKAGQPEGPPEWVQHLTPEDLELVVAIQQRAMQRMQEAEEREAQMVSSTIDAEVIEQQEESGVDDL